MTEREDVRELESSVQFMVEDLASILISTLLAYAVHCEEAVIVQNDFEAVPNEVVDELQTVSTQASEALAFHQMWLDAENWGLDGAYAYSGRFKAVLPLIPRLMVVATALGAATRLPQDTVMPLPTVEMLFTQIEQGEIDWLRDNGKPEQFEVLKEAILDKL